MSKKKLVSILLSAVLCFGMLGSTFSASAASVSVHLTKTQAVNLPPMCTVHLNIIGEQIASPRNTVCTILPATKTVSFGTLGDSI